MDVLGCPASWMSKMREVSEECVKGPPSLQAIGGRMGKKTRQISREKKDVFLIPTSKMVSNYTTPLRHLIKNWITAITCHLAWLHHLFPRKRLKNKMREFRYHPEFSYSEQWLWSVWEYMEERKRFNWHENETVPSIHKMKKGLRNARWRMWKSHRYERNIPSFSHTQILFFSELKFICTLREVISLSFVDSSYL